jgi:HSP20 family protein
MLMRRRSEFPTLLRRTTGNTPVTLSNWLDEVFEDAFNWTEGAFVPELNVYETDTMFEITVELPGMSKDDIDISVDDHVLTISGERRAPNLAEENGRRFHRVESRYGTFTRSLPLPNVIDTGKINASYENGVLTISIPKLKEKAGRKVKIS